MPERRGRRDRYYDDDDLSDYSDYDRPSRSATAPPKRHRSISRRALDRLSSTFGNMGLSKEQKEARARSTGRHRDGVEDSDYDTDYSTNYTHNSKKRSPRSRYHSPDRSRSSKYPPRAGLNRQRSYSYSPERYESRRGRSSHRSTGDSRDPRSRSRWARSMDAALDAAAIEAIRVRKEPGPWTGRKGSRVLTAAIAAAAVGVATEHRNGHEDGSGSKKGKIGSALGGLVINRMLNGPRRELRRDRRY
ncbi:hypothetical protein QBC32DRAFT_351657 [Pseudoneurospora amorphoporcata]|uniref:DUF3824 domain-containing protein n=1 Tax=Pseudoneurospora amorphoporcata TaxID=241081 RepID=A0AAN6NM59_9PEZI|nr:hypothetical protein QBC32DRAFT_351657 [Pseudoneurospora amorphoporcata]